MDDPALDIDPAGLPLPVLASWALIAFTIESDNEFEHRARLRSAAAGATAQPWMVSAVMWANCLRYIPDEGITAATLEAAARTRTDLGGMQRWGWVVLDPSPRNRGNQGLRRHALVTPTRAGRAAREGWPKVMDLVLDRWRERAGAARLSGLVAALEAVVAGLDPSLPDCLPVVRGNWRLSTDLRWPAPAGQVSPPAPAGPPGVELYALLSRLVTGFGLEVEARSPVGCALGHNVLRVMCDQPGPVEVRTIGPQAGLAKESVAVALGELERLGYAEPVAGSGRFRQVRATAAGLDAVEAFVAAVVAVEDRWSRGPGGTPLAALRSELAAVAAGGRQSVLWRGLEPYPDGWRASVAPRRALPWFPVPTHRGGFPDGS